VAPTTPCSTSPTLTKVNDFHHDRCRTAPEPRGETERAGGGYLSYKRAYNPIIQHDEYVKSRRQCHNTLLPIGLPPLACYIHLGGCFTSLSAEECVALPTDQAASPDNFDGDRSKGRTFLTSCELYLSLTGLDYPDEQSRIHWALSFFKSRHAATFAKCIVRQEMRTGVMTFTD
jgi:hypothetical protein